MDRVEVRDARGRRSVVEPLTTAPDTFFESVGFNATGTTMAAGLSDGRVRLWDTSTWHPLVSGLPHHSLCDAQ